MLAGVGFGPNFYKQITNGKGAGENYTYPHRKGALGDMPSTGKPTEKYYHIIIIAKGRVLYGRILSDVLDNHEVVYAL